MAVSAGGAVGVAGVLGVDGGTYAAELRRAADAVHRQHALAATCEAVGRWGWEGATIARIVAHSEMGSRLYWRVAGTRTEAYKAGYRGMVDAFAEEVQRACHVCAGDWGSCARVGVTRILECLAGDPGFARALLVEVHRAGHDMVRERQAAIERVTDAVRSASGLPDTAKGRIRAQFAVGGLLSTIERTLWQGGALDDDALCDHATTWLLATTATVPQPPQST